MGFNPPPGWPVPRGWEPGPDWQPDPSWPPAPYGWRFWTDDAVSSTPVRPPWWRRPVALVVAAAIVVAASVGGVFLLLNRSSDDDKGRAVAGQLRGTFPDRPTVGWTLPSESVYERAEFVRPDATSYQYMRPGFLDLGDTLITAAVQPQSDREATIVAVSADTGTIKWKTADVGFKPACASATVDGLLPCVGQEAVFGPPGSEPPPYVYFLSMEDGTIDHKIEVPEEIRAVEVEGSAVYTMGFDYDPDRSVRVINRGTVDDLTAEWQRTYPLTDDGGCPGSGDTLYDDVDGPVVYTGNDGGVVAAGTEDGEVVLPDVVNLRIFAGQGVTGRVCNSSDPDDVDTIVAGTDGNILRTIPDATYVADPWLVDPATKVPYIIGRTAYDFASGDVLWTAGGGGGDLQRIIGDTVLSGGYGDALGAVDLATGEELWTRDDLDGTPMQLSDGRRVMVTTDAGLEAVDLATGRTTWTLPGIDDREYLGNAGDGFAYAGSESITFYPATGGPAEAPGRGEDVVAGESGEGGLITKCGRTPEMRPVSYRAENGALLVTMEVNARCPGGDIVSTNRLRVTVRDSLGRICSGVFDFSGDPLVLGGQDAEPATVVLTFEPGTFTRHPNTLGGGTASSSGEVVTESKASGTEVVDCEDEGTDTGAQSTEKAATDSGGATTTNGGGIDCGTDADTLDAIRAQADADRPFVQNRLADRWVAQLSSKRPGLVAPDVDGRMVTWTPCEILQQHLRMRGQYPEVRLVWSDEWRTFDLAGWWVTIAGVTFPDADAANGWCNARSIPVDECYAKVVSDSRDSRGSTKYRR